MGEPTAGWLARPTPPSSTESAPSVLVVLESAVETAAELMNRRTVAPAVPEAVPVWRVETAAELMNRRTSPKPKRSGRADSCLHANDGTCDEPRICAPGTDSTDCGN